MDYPWIIEAKKYIGLKEIPGSKHNGIIVKWLTDLKAWWKDDETPWCGVFVAHCMSFVDLYIPKYYMRAKAWSEDWGITLPLPTEGCVVVFDRKGGGHVGFVLGISDDNLLVVLGGNQGNSVSVAKFDRNRVIGYYWPKTIEIPKEIKLARVNIGGEVSKNEA